MENKTQQKVQFKESPIHGWGVFATQDINKDEIIEVCPVLFLPAKRGEINYTLVDYAFQWPRTDDWQNFVVALGYGSLYNHSNTPNANWTNDVENKTFIFFSTKPIKKGEEIFIYYGDENYWSDGRTHVDVK
jgi:SET domain-containing protein